jgi:hypothetical protein
MARACQLARGYFSRSRASEWYWDRDRTGWGTRRAELIATMDHADIRGLVTAFHRSVAGCLALESGIIAMDAHTAPPRIPLTVSAHRVPDPV